MGTTHQRGYVTPRGKQWYGYYRKVVNDPDTNEQKSVRVPVSLGPKSKMTKTEARQTLEREITKQLGQPGSPTRIMNDGSVTFAWFVTNRFLDTDNYRKRVLHKLARDLKLPKLTFQVIRRTIATLAQKKGTVKDVQGVMRHSRTATTTDVYMQEIPASVQSTINSINRELRGLRAPGRKKSPSTGTLAEGRRKAVKRVAKPLTQNDTKSVREGGRLLPVAI